MKKIPLPGGGYKVNMPDCVEYFNAAGQLHREDGPAIECANGNYVYCRNGLRHREDGPAVEWGDIEYYRNGLRHRWGGPALERANGDKLYYSHGQLHRDNGPAIEWANGDQEYWLHGKKVHNIAELPGLTLDLEDALATDLSTLILENLLR